MKRKGFTLVELLVTIILLSVIGGILVFNMTNINKNNKEKDYNRYIATVTSAASAYADLNPDIVSDLYVNKAFVYITVGDLISNGLLDEELTNPYDNTVINKEDLVRVELDSDGELSYEYPIDTKDIKDTFLVALSDYVVWGEPYNCMQGVGTYQLALSNEKGELIDMSNTDNIDKYQFSCTMPSSFKDYNGLTGYKYTEEPGTYEITYNWITEDGVKKSMKRNLKVLAKVVPTVQFFENTTNTGYNPGNEKYKPTYNATANASGTYLVYKVHAEGADEAKTSYILSENVHTGGGTDGHANEATDKFSGNQKWPTDGNYKSGTENTNIRVVCGGKDSYCTDWDKSYAAEDGIIDYNIKVEVKGHYVETYKYTSENTVTAEQDITLLNSLINDNKQYDNDSWSNSKTFTIANPYSPVTIDYYEYYLATSENDEPDSSTIGTKLTDGNVKEIVSGVVSLNKVSECLSSKRVSYPYVFIRAVNKNGYKSSWSEKRNGYITNSLKDLLYFGKKDDSSQNCKKGNLSGTLKGLSCYYTGKYSYIELATACNSGTCTGIKYVVVGIFTDGTILITPENACGTGTTSLVTTLVGHQTAKHCDGVHNYTYNYGATQASSLTTYLSSYVSSLPTLAANVKSGSYAVKKTWKTSLTTYTGVAGIITNEQYNTLKNVLSISKTYWLGDTKISYHHMSQADDDVHKTSITYTSSEVLTTRGYVSNGNYSVKCIFAIRNMAACGGTGSYSDPYVLVGTGI